MTAPRRSATSVGQRVRGRMKGLLYRAVAASGAGAEVRGAAETSRRGENVIGRGTDLLGSVVLGYGTTIGTNCTLLGPVEIGNYCQFGPNVGVYGANHPSGHGTQYVNRMLLGGAMQSKSPAQLVKIDHDVWIGHGAVVLPGVHIGTGCVVGAGAVVTTDLPAYSVAVGVPARVIGPRLPAELVELLLASRWWELRGAELEVFREFFSVDLRAEPARGRGLLVDAIARAGETGRQRSATPGSSR